MNKIAYLHAPPLKMMMDLGNIIPLVKPQNYLKRECQESLGGFAVGGG